MIYLYCFKLLNWRMIFDFSYLTLHWLHLSDCIHVSKLTGLYSNKRRLLFYFEVQFHNNLLQNICRDGLWQNFVHSAVYGSINVLCLGVSSHCQDNWLRYILIIKERPYLIGRLVSVHEGHVAVHQNQVIGAYLEIVINHILFDLL